MIKLTQILFEVKKEVDEKIVRLSNAFQKALDEYEAAMMKFSQNPYGEAPISPIEPKPMTLKKEDYDEKRVVFYIDPKEISYITQTTLGDTIIGMKSGDRITVEGTPEDIFNLL
jgi:hypothetical protein